LKKRNIAYTISIVCGVMLWVTSIVHMLGLNDTLIALKIGDISKAYEANLVIIWIFGGVCMFLLGAWLLFLSPELKKGSKKAWRQVLVISISLCLFGLASWLEYPKVVHVLYFFLVGLLLLIALMAEYRFFYPRSQTK
jgi:peptidoglycan/LPS O-acetylase OafA/YrhL